MLTEENIKAIEYALAKEKRVELIPTKDSVRVIQIERKEIK